MLYMYCSIVSVLCFLAIIYVLGGKLSIFKTVMLLVVTIALVLPAMLFSNSWMNISSSTTNTTGNVSVVLYSVVIPTTPSTVEGPKYSAESSGLKVTAVLSNSSVGVGEDLVVRVVLEGEKAADVGIVHVEVLNSSEQRVYGVNVWIPHTTSTPIDRNKPIWFDEVWHIPKDAEPGIYKVVVEAYINNEKVSAEGTINVAK